MTISSQPVPEPVAAMVRPLLRWYRENARKLPWRDHPTPYRVWVSEIMLQQTRVEAVIPYYLRFMEALPDIAALAAVEEQQLLKLWEGLGYYSRARNLQKAARMVIEQYGGELPADLDQLRGLPGIGEYTAGAIASIAFGLPVPAVDGNVLRVLSRLTASEADILSPQTKKCFARLLAAVYPPGQASHFTQALMELGACVCLPNGAPLCESCPVAPLCEARRRGLQNILPVKAQKKPRRIVQKTVLLLCCGDRTAIRRRPASGLLAGLWELPSVDEPLTQAGVEKQLQSWGLDPLPAVPGPAATHIFTHIEWRMTSWRVPVKHPADVQDLLWATPGQLREEYPLPAAFRPFLPT